MYKDEHNSSSQCNKSRDEWNTRSHYISSSHFIFPYGLNTRNHHNLIPIKRQEPSHRPVAPIRTLPNVILNARSILNKVDELKAHIDNYKSDILFVTETWLTESIPNEAASIFLEKTEP